MTGSAPQMYRIHIKATPEAVWEAITSPEWTRKYGYQCLSLYDLRPGGAFSVAPSDEMRAFSPELGEFILDGEVLESDPPKRLVQTFRTLWDEEAKAEGFTRLTYELVGLGEVTRLTLIHELADAPRSAGLLNGDIEPFGGGWPEILSDLKTLLETGAPMRG
jgi:uncharacterized protein YndB with AHSA1/START domain